MKQALFDIVMKLIAAGIVFCFLYKHVLNVSLADCYARILLNVRIPSRVP